MNLVVTITTHQFNSCNRIYTHWIQEKHQLPNKYHIPLSDTWSLKCTMEDVLPMITTVDWWTLMHTNGSTLLLLNLTSSSHLRLSTQHHIMRICNSLASQFHRIQLCSTFSTFVITFRIRFQLLILQWFLECIQTQKSHSDLMKRTIFCSNCCQCSRRKVVKLKVVWLVKKPFCRKLKQCYRDYQKISKWRLL